MAKFIKLILKGVPRKGDVYHWALVIDNIEDLKKYHSLDAELNMNAYLGMERKNDKLIFSHLGVVPTRQLVLNQCINMSINCTPEGEKVYPIIEVAKFTDSKYLSMLKHILTTGAIQINPAGGWCSYEAYIKTWDAEIIEVLEKKSFGFPVDDEILKADTIILENAHHDFIGEWGNYFCSQHVPDAGKIEHIFNLKEVDETYIYKCLVGTRNIVISTEANDESQVDNFIELFKKLPRKNIYIYTTVKTQNKLKNHPYFNSINSIHNIVFVTL